MPGAPDSGQGREGSARPAENTRQTRSQTARNHRTPTPLPAEPDTAHFPTPAEAARARSPASAQKAKVTKAPTPLDKITRMLEQLVAKHNPPGQVKMALTEIMEFAKKAAEEEKGAGAHAPLNAVKHMHDRLKADLLVVHSDLDAKITELQHKQEKILSTTESLSKSTESLRSTTRDLESKVLKVNDTTDKLATTTMSYRDAILAKPANSNRTSADPKILNSVDKRARQILMGFNAGEDNATLTSSLVELKDKANKIVEVTEDGLCPGNVKIESITRTRDGSLLLLINSKEGADWLREPGVIDNFIDCFATGAVLRDRNYHVLIKWVPIVLDPTNRAHLREIEEVNNLPEHSIHKMRWIKPTIRRQAGQTKAHAILTLNSADVANRTIRDGLEICGARTKAERSKQEPLQCLKCRGWEHKAQTCEATMDTCGTCGENHRTSDCTNKNNPHCASCKSNAHASWDRTCPEFIRRCAIYDERHPENSMVYFPTDEDWTLTTRPIRVPLEDRFPKHLAVNSLQTNTQKPHKSGARRPTNNPSRGSRPPITQAPRTLEQQGTSNPINRLLIRTQPNLVPLGQGREEGELSERPDLDSTIDYADNADVERALDWSAEPPMVGGWNHPNNW